MFRNSEPGVIESESFLIGTCYPNVSVVFRAIARGLLWQLGTFARGSLSMVALLTSCLPAGTYLASLHQT